MHILIWHSWLLGIYIVVCSGGNGSFSVWDVVFLLFRGWFMLVMSFCVCLVVGLCVSSVYMWHWRSICSIPSLSCLYDVSRSCLVCLVRGMHVFVLFGCVCASFCVATCVLALSVSISIIHW